MNWQLIPTAAGPTRSSGFRSAAVGPGRLGDLPATNRHRQFDRAGGTAVELVPAFGQLREDQGRDDPRSRGPGDDGHVGAMRSVIMIMVNAR